MRLRVLAYVMPTTAIHRLPNELLSETFRLGHGRYNATDNHAIQYLCRISSFCRIWRNVALNESSLWTNIVYEGTLRTPGYFPRETEERIASYLLRSRNSGLKYSLCVLTRWSWIDAIERHNTSILSAIAAASTLNSLLIAMHPSGFPCPGVFTSPPCFLMKYTASARDLRRCYFSQKPITGPAYETWSFSCTTCPLLHSY